MTIGSEIIAILLTVNGLLITILLQQISRLNTNLDKIWTAVDTKVEANVCTSYRELCFKTCPERHKGAKEA